MRRFFLPAPCFVSSLLDFLSHGVDWRDADDDELAVRRLKGFRSLSDSCLCFWLDRSNGRRCCTALTSSSSPSDLSICPMSMGRAPPFASCPASFSPTCADTRFRSSSKWKGPSRNRPSMSHGSHCCCFHTVSQNLVLNKCQFSLHDCHLEHIHVLGALFRYEPRHRRSMFHH